MNCQFILSNGKCFVPRCLELAPDSSTDRALSEKGYRVNADVSAPRFQPLFGEFPEDPLQAAARSISPPLGRRRSEADEITRRGALNICFII